MAKGELELEKRTMSQSHGHHSMQIGSMGGKCFSYYWKVTFHFEGYESLIQGTRASCSGM